jgi:hypothetical protein
VVSFPGNFVVQPENRGHGPVLHMVGFGQGGIACKSTEDQEKKEQTKCMHAQQLSGLVEIGEWATTPRSVIAPV